MKIAIISDFFYPEMTGVTDTILLSGRELARRGHTIMYVVPWYPKKSYSHSQTQINLEPNIIVKRLPSIKHPFSPTKQGYIGLPIGVGLLALHQFKPDIIHTHSMYGPGLEATLYAKTTCTPLVGTNHTPVSEFMPGSPSWLVRIILRYTSWYYNLCSFVSAPCQALLDEMKRYGMTTTQSPVPNPVELERFTPAKDEKEKIECKTKFGLSAHSVLYTGRLGIEKHVDVIISAIAQARADIPDISLAVTGHGTAKKSLQDQVQKLGISDRVKFLGFVNDADFPAVYRASDIFAIMSTADTQSLSLMQALATGLPGIVARSWGLPEYVTTENGGSEHPDGIVLDVGDVDGLAKTFINLFKNPAQMKKMGENGVINVKKYSVDTIANRWEELYKIAILQK